jgi:hypothetical protein
LAAQGFDEVIVATGVTPRVPDIDGIGHGKCASYVEVLDGSRQVGAVVAVLGAGGIGFDIAEYLTSAPQEIAASGEHFLREWGVDDRIVARGGLAGHIPSPLVGEGQGGGDSRTSKVGLAPTPDPSPPGGGAQVVQRGSAPHLRQRSAPQPAE